MSYHDDMQCRLLYLERKNKMLRELLNKAEEIIKPLCNSEYSYLRIASEKFLKDLKEAGDE